MRRNITLDLSRTLAIVLMVVFHFIYDLRFFGLVDFDIPDGNGWKHFRWLIISLFFLCLGASLSLAHAKQIRYQKFIFRVAQIGFFALVISLTTYYAIPDNWIFFGVLHFLAFASIVMLPFVNRPILSLIIGGAFFVLASFKTVPNRWPLNQLIDDLPKYTNDHVALVPWLGMVFLGVFLSHTTWFKNDPLATLINTKGKLKPKTLQLIVWPGQHSLSIYVLHQPIMMGILFLFIR